MTQRDCDDCYYSKLEGEKEPCKSCKATDDGFTNFREVPLTNADRIRAMSDEELASLLTDHSNNGGWVTETGRKVCYDLIIEWLQQPAEEEKHETD